MDKMSNKEMEALFSQMIGNMKAYAQKNEERIDKQLWQPVKEPLLYGFQAPSWRKLWC